MTFLWEFDNDFDRFAVAVKILLPGKLAPSLVGHVPRELSQCMWYALRYSAIITAEIKGYLCYKTITSQNVPLKQRLRTFLFRRRIMFRSQDIQVFLFLTIPWFTKSVTSRWVLVHETRYIFEYIFWITTHEVTKHGQLIDISKNNNF